MSEFRLDREIKGFYRTSTCNVPFARLSLGGHTQIALSKTDVDELEKAIKKFKQDEANVWNCYSCDNVDFEEFSWTYTCKLTGKVVDAYGSCEKHDKRCKGE